MPYFVLISQRMMWTHGLTRLTNIRRSRRAMVLRTMMVVHMTAVVQSNSANTTTTLRTFSPGGGSEQGSHTHTCTFTMPCAWVRLCGWISANLSQHFSAVVWGVGAISTCCCWSSADTALHMITTRPQHSTHATKPQPHAEIQSSHLSVWIEGFGWIVLLVRVFAVAWRLLGWFGWLPECW